MLTLDKLLAKLVDNDTISSSSQVTLEDKKVLLSLRQQLKRLYFFTEKQGILLTKLMQKNKEYFLNLENKDIETINTPSWSEDFRKIEEIKKIYFTDDKKTFISVEFSRDTDFKKKLTSLFSRADIKQPSISNKLVVSANEYNIITLMDFLKKYDFDIDVEIQKIHDKILEEIQGKENYYDILEERNKKLFEIVSKDSTEENRDLLLLDRRIRFQYTFVSKNNNNSLAYKIANRNSTDIWIDEKTIEFNEIIKSLVELNRFPLLLIFNSNNPQQSLMLLEKLNTAMDVNEIDKTVGIYFRFDNDSDQEFNQKIKNLQFNNYLSSETNVVGLSTKQIPKFLLSNNWYPKTVITNVSNFRNSKVFSYCKAVDLIICHSDSAPLTGGYDAIV